MRLRFFLVIACVCVFISTAQADLYSEIPAQHVHDEYTKTVDGADLHMTHLSHPRGTRVVLVHGVGVSGGSFEILANRLWREQADVLVADLRGTYKLPKGMTPFGPRNGIKEDGRFDIPAILDHSIATMTPEQLKEGIILLGHSNGGVAIGGMLTDDTLRARYSPFIRGMILNQSPQDVKEISSAVKLGTYVGYPMLQTLKSAGVVTINMHSKVILYAKDSQQLPDFRGKYITPAVLRSAAFITRQIFNPKHTRPDAWRRAMLNMPAYSIAVDKLLDYGRAIIVDNGEYLDQDDGKTRLVQPEKFGDIPTLLIRAEKDTLAPMNAQARYFEAIGSIYKRMLTLRDFNHTDSVLVTNAESDFYHHIFDFMKNPKEFTQNHPAEIVFEPQCQGLLTRALHRIFNI